MLVFETSKAIGFLLSDNFSLETLKIIFVPNSLMFCDNILSYEGFFSLSSINLHIQTLNQSCHFPDLLTYLLPPNWVLLDSTQWARSPRPCSPSLGVWVATHPLSSSGSALPHPLVPSALIIATSISYFPSPFVLLGLYIVKHNFHFRREWK